jgi:hypothetical protein
MWSSGRLINQLWEMCNCPVNHVVVLGGGYGGVAR